MSAVLAPEWLSLVREETHGHRLIAVHIVPLGVPNELSARGKSKVTNILSMENPCLRILGLFLFVFFGFFWRDDKHRLLGDFRLCKPFSMLLGQNLIGVL